MANTISISDVFKSTGQPTVTYVERDQGKYEHILSAGIDGRGQLCLVTGPSKTGKTTLYKRVLETKNLLPIVVRCDNDLTAIEFWRRALEQVNFSQLATTQSTTGLTTQVSAKIGGNVGWKWLAGLTGDIGGSFSGSGTEGDVRQRILASPSPLHLIPVLKELPAMLVIEDFHYLDIRVQSIIFQQWKSFIDNEVSVILLGTTHHAVDIAYSNSDLLGRISQIDVARWDDRDLQQIVEKGLSHLSVNVGQNISTLIAKESAGLPIITQQVCEQLFVDKRLAKIVPGGISPFTINDVQQALFHVATRRYSALENYYNTITRGPRRRARRYNTYELVLACFSQEPVQFSLARYEIDQRLRSYQSRPRRYLRPDL